MQGSRHVIKMPDFIMVSVPGMQQCAATHQNSDVQALM
jgi:hypothetical protein